MGNLPKLRVTFIAGTLGQGGAERQLYYIVKALKQSGTQAQVLSLTRGEFWEEKIQALGIPVIWVGQNESKIARLHRIIRELRKHPADIVQSQHFFTNLYAVAAARALGFQEVGAMRSDGINEVKANGRILGRLSLKTPRAIAANSKAAIRNAVAMGMADKCLHFLPNVINCQEFYISAKPESDTIRLITVGRLVKEKRQERFLFLLAQLRQQTKLKIQGQIIGDGPLRQYLEEVAAELNLGPEILEFKGRIADMSLIYREADIFVLTSDYEGTPNVILEAMASGLPVVAPRVGGIPDLVQDHQTGYLTDGNDAIQMQQALGKLVNCPSARLAMGQLARDYVMANHSTGQLPRLLENLYETVLS
jgi:glycosyltransferase involved in cell wall biosynthesis